MFLVQVSYRPRTGVVQAPGKKAAPCSLRAPSVPITLRMSAAKIVLSRHKEDLTGNEDLL